MLIQKSTLVGWSALGEDRLVRFSKVLTNGRSRS